MYYYITFNNFIFVFDWSYVDIDINFRKKYLKCFINFACPNLLILLGLTNNSIVLGVLSYRSI